MTKKLQGAVLVIGSLFWENEQNAIESEKGKGRHEWRNEHLSIEEKIRVSCDIRYGRISNSRFNTYTMIFSNGVPARGTGWLIPLQKPVEGGEWLLDIFKEALALSWAEGIDGASSRKLYKTWGAVALAISPIFQTDHPEQATRIKEEWAELHKDFDNRPFQRAGEEPVITREGFLNVSLDWSEIGPQTDFILTTVTAPSGSLDPNPRMIYNAMENANPIYYTYFLENVKNGISTFQDQQIEQLLPSYLQSAIPIFPKRIKFENYSPTLGEWYFRSDLLRIMGNKIYASTFQELAHHILSVFDYDQEIAELSAKGDINSVYQHFIQRYEAYFSGWGAYFEKDPDPAVAFVNNFLLFEKLPLKEKERLEPLVLDDLKKRTQQVMYYESLPTIIDFRKKPTEPKTQQERMIFDYYQRNVVEQQGILRHLLFELENRILGNCTEQYDISMAAQAQRSYMDRPYLTSVPFNTTPYFDHRLIDKSRHRLYGIEIPLVDANELWSLYAANKPSFYQQLIQYRTVAKAFDEIKSSFAFHPSILGKRVPIVLELKDLFEEKKWYSFYALALSQIEGLFSEMAAAVQPGEKHTGLPSKVAGVRSGYSRAQNYFDYFQYYIPVLRNRFMHLGYDKIDEWTCYDLLFDVRYLAIAFHELNTPLIQINKIINERSDIAFADAAGFNEYFKLLALLRDSRQYGEIRSRVEEFENSFLAEQISPYFVGEIRHRWEQSFSEWSQLVFDLSESLGKPLRLHLLTKRDVIENKDNIRPYLEKCIVEYFSTYEHLFAINYFLKKIWEEVPHLSEEAQKGLEEIKTDFKTEFEFWEGMESTFSDLLAALRS